MGNIIIHNRNGKQEAEYMKKNAAKPENTSVPDTRGKIESNNNAKSSRTVGNPQSGISGSQPDRKIPQNPSPDYDMPSMMRPWDEEFRTGGDEEELRW